MAVIPDKTQAHVDRLVGAKVGPVTVLESLAEGRFGTLYRASRDDGSAATVEVLRLGVEEREGEVRSVDALSCPGVPATSGFGALSDGRRYRLLGPLDGESLERRLLRRGPLPAVEVVALLTRVAEVLQVTHAWAVFHGSLVPSSVWVLPDGSVRLLDYGLWKSAPGAETDLVALAALGRVLLRGDPGAGHPDPTPVPIAVERLLVDLEARRVPDMSTAVRLLARCRVEPPSVQDTHISAPRGVPAARPRRRWWLAVPVGLGLVGALAGAVRLWPAGAEDEAREAEDVEVLEAAVDAQPDVVPSQRLDEDDAQDRPVAGVRKRTPARREAVVPTPQQLQDIMTRFERQLRAQARPGTDLSQPLSVLSQQRLRLAGSPTMQDRRDVAKKLVGWRQSYLKH